MLETHPLPPLVDAFGRTMHYIRISVTDRCNLRCRYCMPEAGVAYQPHDSILTYEEIVRLVSILAACGMTTVKLTGGEPLVRPKLHRLVEMLYDIPGISSVTLTTNGLHLSEQLPLLYAAGIRQVNISLDAITPALQTKISRRETSLDITALLDELQTYPDMQVKLNCVPMRDFNMEELPLFAALSARYKIPVRFIELMPIGLGTGLTALSEEEIRQILSPVTGCLLPSYVQRGNGPAVYYTNPEFEGIIGFISAVSHKFCEKCNRIRLTADGFLKTCLQYDLGADLKLPLRTNASDAAIYNVIRKAIAQKPQAHRFHTAEGPDLEQKMMSQIGG